MLSLLKDFKLSSLGVILIVISVISPQKILYEGTIYEGHAYLPKFLFGASLMGLQRNLFLLKYLFDFEYLKVTGFNFSLSNDPYGKWYPSLIRKNYGDLYKGIVISNAGHDFLLNLMFTRKFLKGKAASIEGEINDICNKNIKQNIELFSSIYSRKREK